MPKYLVVTGGVMSGLGKGIAAASIGKLLKDMGFKVIPIKFDGYLNMDAGTMNPYEHGEVFVLEDGAECDMDLGTYERFLDVDLFGENNITSGKLFYNVIQRERKGEYLGQTVQFIPHVTEEAKSWIREVARKQKADIVLIEVGGTVGDIENAYFIEAIRELALEEGRENFFFVHVTLIPVIDPVGEQKSKPTQHSVSVLRSIGIQPDMIVGRCRKPLTSKVKRKISLFCDVPEEAVISDHDVESIYRVPFLFKEQGVHEIIVRKLGLKPKKKEVLRYWEEILSRCDITSQEVRIAIVGKYTGLKDSYASLIEAIRHAEMHLGVKARIKWVESTDIEERSPEELLSEVSGVIVPGGFGKRGVKGKISAIEHARVNRIPYLGLCFGMQLAVVEFARNVCGLTGANSTEIDPKTPHPVVDILPEQREIDELGGTMRLGSFPAILREGTLVWRIYGKSLVYERHRHRYEINPEYVSILTEHGLTISGTSPDGRLVEFVEISKHPFFIGTQAHPEFKSRLDRPHPLFVQFLKSCMNIVIPKEKGIESSQQIIGQEKAHLRSFSTGSGCSIDNEMKTGDKR